MSKERLWELQSINDWLEREFHRRDVLRTARQAERFYQRKITGFVFVFLALFYVAVVLLMLALGVTV